MPFTFIGPVSCIKSSGSFKELTKSYQTEQTISRRCTYIGRRVSSNTFCNTSKQLTRHSDATTETTATCVWMARRDGEEPKRTGTSLPALRSWVPRGVTYVPLFAKRGFPNVRIAAERVLDKKYITPKHAYINGSRPGKLEGLLREPFDCQSTHILYIYIYR